MSLKSLIEKMDNIISESDTGDTPISKMSDSELADYLGCSLEKVKQDRADAEEKAHDKSKDTVEEDELSEFLDLAVTQQGLGTGGSGGSSSVSGVGSTSGSSSTGGQSGATVGGKHDDMAESYEQLDEIAPALAAGARLALPYLSKIGQVLSKGATTAGKAAADVAGKTASGVGRGVVDVAKSVGQSAAQNAGAIGAGAGTYEIAKQFAETLPKGLDRVYTDVGQAAKDIATSIGDSLDGKTVFEIATTAVKYALPVALVLGVLYGGKKLIDQFLSEAGIHKKMAEDTKETSTGIVHKAGAGGYGRKFDMDDEGDEKKPAAPAVKRGRGRPRKGADSDTGEVKKWDTETLSRWVIGSKPKTLPGKPGVKHKLKDWMEHIERKTIVEGIVHEGRMGEVHMTLQDIVNGNSDLYDVMNHPRDAVQEYVSKILHKKYERIAGEEGLHPDDDFEKIQSILMNELEAEFGSEINEVALDPSQVAAPQVKAPGAAAPATQTTQSATTGGSGQPTAQPASAVGGSAKMGAAIIDFKNPNDPLQKALQQAVKNKQVTVMTGESLQVNESIDSRSNVRDLEKILSNYPHEHKMAQEGWGVVESLYQALCDHYWGEGRIPRDIMYGPSENLRTHVEECYMEDTKPVMENPLAAAAVRGLAAGAGSALVNKLLDDDQQMENGMAEDATQMEQTMSESKLSEKYMGHEKLTKSLAAKGAKDPAALASWIGRQKYGKEKFQKAAAAGKKMGEDVEVEESGLQAYLGKKKYGEKGMEALQKAGREGASKEEMAKLRAKFDKLDEQDMTEDADEIKNLKNKIRKLEKQAEHYSFEPGEIDPESGHSYRPNYVKTIKQIKELKNQLKQLKSKQGVAEGSESEQEHHDRMHRLAAGYKDMSPEIRARKEKIPGWKDQHDQALAYVEKHPKKDEQGVAEGVVSEKLTKSMSAGEVISDFVHSDDPKFKGKSKKERTKMALGAYYGMHPEKSKKKTEESDMQMEAWDQQLNQLLNEGLSITTSTGNEHSPDSVSVNATDADAHELMKLIQSAGLGKKQSMSMSAPAQDAATVTVEPVSQDEVMGTLEPQDDGQEAFGFLKRMLGARGEHGADVHGDYEHEDHGDEACGECGHQECQCDHKEEVDEMDNYEATQHSHGDSQMSPVPEGEMEEGNLFTGNLAKARAAGKEEADLDGDGDMEKVKEELKGGQKELDVAEPKGKLDAKDFAALRKSKVSEAAPNPADFRDADDWADAGEQDLAAAVAQNANSREDAETEKEIAMSEDAEICTECGGAMHEDHECGAVEGPGATGEKYGLEYFIQNEDVELNEWANSPNGSSKDESFIADIAYLTKSISGGLNGIKQDQTVLPSTRVKTDTERMDANTSMAEMLRKLSGIN